MGLGWEGALDMIDYSGADAPATFAWARQQPRVLRVVGASREIRLPHNDLLPYFDATPLEVANEIDVSDGRFWICAAQPADPRACRTRGSPCHLLPRADRGMTSDRQARLGGNRCRT